MLKNLLYLSDGTCISSGAGQNNAIQSCTITECVNNGDELTMGSTCCACLETKIFAPSGGLSIPVGEELILCKVQDGGEPVQVGVFLPERPVKAGANLYKLTAYDKVSLLDKDISAWLKGVEWPENGYPLLTFAGMVCTACGLTLATTYFPNAGFRVRQFYKAGVTGRQLMKWIGEVSCRFCRANAKGEIELAWYTDSGVTIQPVGDRYYFAGSLNYEDYEVAPIDAVKLRLADSDSGALWPDGYANNPYIISGNPILMAQIDEDLPAYLEAIRLKLAALPKYRPCKVSLPASLDIRAGHMVQILDKNGAAFTTCIMTKIQTGQRDTLECTGYARRDSATAANNQSAAQTAQRAVDNQTQEDIFNKLTKNGTIKGIYVQDGVWYINADLAKIVNLVADVIQSGTLDAAKVTIKNLAADVIMSGTLDAKKVTIENLVADLITAGKLKAADGGKTYFDLDSGKFVSTDTAGNTVTIAGGAITLSNSSGVTQMMLLRSNGQNTIMLFDSSGAIAGGIGSMSEDFLVFAPDEDFKGQIVGHKATWKTINGEKVLRASS